MPVIERSPFSDAVGPDTVPKRGSGKGEYDKPPAPGLPGRDGGMLDELTYDGHFGKPKDSGPIERSPFKDAVS